MADDNQTSGEDSGKPTTDMEALMDVEVEITAVLGTSMMPISQILKLGRGAVVELNRSVGEDIEVHANNRAVAKGEVIVVDDRLGVTMTEIIKTVV
ncbi:MAG: flagellar motor switch protein FliN [Rhodospirillales bacterium]|nr:flagellar motor switch protein FliN [Alphaproteobacteria bacterium]MBL6948196.1 flagellar motor switch protein FliN [Rhodospirillales bacterium]